MPSLQTIKIKWQILTLYTLLAILLVGGLMLTRPLPGWRAKAMRLAKIVLPGTVAGEAGGNYASSDRFLAALELNRPSETLVALIAELAPDETALFVGPANDPAFTQLFFTFSYLSWPHQIAVLGCGVDGAQPIFQPRAGVRVARAFFYLQSSPSRLTAGSRALSPKLKVIQVAKGEEWTSYCSQ